MYSLESVTRGLKNPKLVLRELNRLYHTRLRHRSYNPEGINVFGEDWDNLIVLDACRPELVEEKAPDTDRVISRGSSTIEFLEGNFSGDLTDTVYVTANPHFTEFNERFDARFHAVYDVWGGDGWNDIHDTVMPETVSAQAVQAENEHPEKRIVIHFMQPHYPFLEDDERIPRTANIWHKVFSGELSVSQERVWEAYRSTFDRVWEEVQNLKEELSGKTVVTSDHTNLYGERVSPLPVREWGHPIGIYDRKLVEVPWLELDFEERKKITEDPPSEESTDQEEVKEKLKALGY